MSSSSKTQPVDSVADLNAVGDHERASGEAALQARVKELEDALHAHVLQAEFSAKTTALQAARIAELEVALQAEQARSEGTADALMRIARASDDRAREMETQHAAALAAKDSAITKLESATVELKASHAAILAAKMELSAVKDATISELKAEVAVLKAQAASTLLDIHAAIAAHQTLEIYPVRPADSRQFAAWLSGPVPPLPLMFDRAWAAAYSRRDKYTVNIDAATGTRVTLDCHTGKREDCCLTFRSTAPLPPPPPPPPPPPHHHQAAGTSMQQSNLSMYRVVLEAYDGWCDLGFIPGQPAGPGGSRGAASFSPTADYSIAQYGGWYIRVAPSGERAVHAAAHGWVALPPFASDSGDRVAAAASGAAAADGRCSAYATTDEIPPVPAGSAVEFAVDYAAGTCRVAFYTPDAVAGGFVEPPHTKMELRFVATEVKPVYNIPARAVPNGTDTELYPAVTASSTATALRLVA